MSAGESGRDWASGPNAKDLLEGLLERLPVAAVLLDRMLGIKGANALAESLFRVPCEQLIDRPLGAFVAASRVGGVAALVEARLCGSDGDDELLVPIRCGDGREELVEISVGARIETAAPAVVQVTLRPSVARSSESSLLQSIIDGSRDAVLAVDVDRRVLAVNRRFFELWQLEPDLVEIGDLSPALSDAQRSKIIDPDAFESALRWGHDHPEVDQTLEVPLIDGRLLIGYAVSLFDRSGRYLGRVWYMHDETQRRASESQREQLMSQLARAEEAQRFLLDASDVLARSTGFLETLESLAKIAVPRLGDLCLIDVVSEERGGSIERVAAVHADSERMGLVRMLRRYPPDPKGQHPSARAMRERSSQWSREMSEAFLRDTVRDDEHFELLAQLDFSSYMAVPLVVNDRALGAIILVSTGSRRRVGPDDLALAENLAGRVALVVAKERRYDLEHNASHALQASLLPRRLPRVPGLELAVRYVPGTRDMEVGGDFWDVAVLSSGEIAVAVGDVAGHDMAAAATMAQLRSALRALREYSKSPDELIRLLHHSWSQLELERIATAVFARVHPGHGSLTIATAGHPPPVIVEEKRAWFAPLDPATPFGAVATDRGAWRGTLAPGAAAVFYTDGLVEDRALSIDQGMGRLLKVVAEAPSYRPEELADHVLSSLSGEDRADDVALLVMYRERCDETR